MSEKNLYQKICSVMKEVGYIKKDANVSAGPGGNYKAVTHDAVAAMVRPRLSEYGIVVLPSLMESSTVAGQTRSGASKIRYEAKYSVTFINADKPEEQFIVNVEAHAEDSGDKAPGKALSYAVKMALLKVLMVETGESDESRYLPDEKIEREPLHTPGQEEALQDLLAADDGYGLLLLSRDMSQETWASLIDTSLPPKGQGRMEHKRRIKSLMDSGWEMVDTYAARMEEAALNGDDLAVKELKEEVGDGKRLVWDRISPQGKAALEDMRKAA